MKIKAVSKMTIMINLSYRYTVRYIYYRYLIITIFAMKFDLMKNSVSDREVKLRENIIEQATKLFKIFGYNKLVMEDIARAVGKGRTTLYIYFKDKEAIFNAVIESELKEYFFKIEQEIPKHELATDKFVTFLKIKFEFRNKKATEYRTMTEEMTSHPEILNMMRVLSDPFEIKHLSHILKTGSSTGEFEDMDNSKIEITTRLIISAMDGISNDTTSKPNATDNDVVLERLLSFFSKALQRNN